MKSLTGFFLDMFKTQNTKTDVIVTAALIINLSDTNRAAQIYSVRAVALLLDMQFKKKVGLMSSLNR